MDYKVSYQNWIANPLLCDEGLKELNSIKDNEKEIEYSFGAELEFGTAGMRGIIGYGTNKMNIYTVRRATQGLASYIQSSGFSSMRKGVVISYDTRNKSELFARTAAGVLLKNNINGEMKEVDFEGFGHLLLWQKHGAKYICIEPWCGVPDFVDSDYDITNKKDVICLEKAERRVLTHSIIF